MLNVKSLVSNVVKKLEKTINPNYVDSFNVRHIYFTDSQSIKEILLKDGKIIAKNEINIM